jgi:tetratricopeptide (TPR) repeat protein
MKQRLAFVLAICFSFLLTGAAVAPVSAKDSWTSVRSKNFQLVGNASEKDIRRVGIRLEQFREVFSRLFSTLNLNSPIPTTVIVFKNDESYRPFKPNANTVGYFQPGPDVNYITLRLGDDLHSNQDPFAIIFHEYTHLLIKNTSGDVPTWFNEGLAEYYSTFSITDDQKIVMGRPIASHVHLLRENKMLPLRTLFKVDPESPYYNERDKQSIFYAESWALIHYLILGNDGKRLKEMGKFGELVSASVPMEQAFRQAFAMSFEEMESQLRGYVRRESYPIVTGSFSSKVTYDTALQAGPLTEAEAQAYLGDLLLHSNREDSETYLQKALALNPNLAMANASLGMLRARQGKTEEAIRSLERAMAAGAQNYLVHYNYAYVLSRAANRDTQTVLEIAPETAAKIRSELNQAIQLSPDFADSYSLLAFVNLATDSNIDATLELLKRTVARFPDHHGLVFMLGQLYMRKQDFKTARQLLDRLTSDNDEELRRGSQKLLRQMDSIEEQLANIRAARGDGATSNSQDSSIANGETKAIEIDPSAVLRESLRKPTAGVTQAQGKLARVDCDAKGITFVVRISERLLKLVTDSFEHVDLITFSADAGGQLTCGQRKPENNVVVSYLPATEPRPKIDGVLKSVEFVPQDFKLKP